MSEEINLEFKCDIDDCVKIFTNKKSFEPARWFLYESPMVASGQTPRELATQLVSILPQVDCR